MNGAVFLNVMFLDLSVMYYLKKKKKRIFLLLGFCIFSAELAARRLVAFFFSNTEWKSELLLVPFPII